MELWHQLALGALSVILLSQLIARSDRALRARRWSPLIYIPLMLAAAISIHRSLGLPGYVWGWLGLTFMLDELVSDIRLSWRARRARQPAA